MTYRLVRPALFALDAERSHDLAFRALALPGVVPALRATLGAAIDDPVDCCGLRFANRVGLAAGLDKDGRAVDAFGAMGFGFLEVGTVTPRAQPGNPKPRLFRLPARSALINRFGFNNAGVDALCRRVSTRRWQGVLGVNIGKNADTPTASAVDDYVACLRTAASVADYITINVSSPNTRNLRDLQAAEALDTLLQAISEVRAAAAEARGRALPLLLKVAPDLDDAERADIASAVARHGVDGVIASNTTTDRSAVAGLSHADEAGGLSGEPLRKRTAGIVAHWRRLLGPDTGLIAAGGIAGADDAHRAISAGADLVQLYTGLIYEGPGVVRRIAATLRDGATNGDSNAF
ncbi:MAG: quinone-dependent dihydroorotate dehydrogenase [Pseudomonadota bacterium]